MPEISQRGLQMPASPIRKLAPLSDAAKAEGGKSISPEHRVNLIFHRQSRRWMLFAPSTAQRWNTVPATVIGFTEKT